MRRKAGQCKSLKRGGSFTDVRRTKFHSCSEHQLQVPSLTFESGLKNLQCIDSSLFFGLPNLLDTDQPRKSISKQMKKKSCTRASRRLAHRNQCSKVDRNQHLCLKPGALAHLRHSHGTCTASCTTIGRKRVVGVDGEGSAGELALRVPASSRTEHSPSPDRSSGASLRVFESECSPRKRFASPRTPSTPAALISLIGDADDEAMESGGGSLLDALPLDLLVRIVCSLHHDELKPVFHVSRRLRKAVSIARQCHFNFTTPDRERQEKLGLCTPRPDENWPFPSGPEALDVLVRPATPKAPRQAPKPAHGRISVAEMRQIAAPLFQELSSHSSHPKLPRPILRGLASHRVLFYEEELCQAVAQNTI